VNGVQLELGLLLGQSQQSEGGLIRKESNCVHMIFVEFCAKPSQMSEDEWQRKVIQGTCEMLSVQFDVSEAVEVKVEVNIKGEVAV
jgi:hypothetical protein